MTISLGNLLQLREYQTNHLCLVDTRAPETYFRAMLTEGNSLLSSVFIESLDVGASLEVNYWDSSAANPDVERYDLASHGILGTAGTYRRLITKIHNKPNIECIVRNGNVRFGVYVTVVSSFASDTDSSLIYDGQSSQPSNDKGMIVAGLHEDSGTLQFFRISDNGLLVDIGGSVSGLFNVVSNRITGTALVDKDDTVILFDQLITTDTFLFECLVGGDGMGLFKFYVNSSDWGEIRNAYQERQTKFNFGGKTLVNGDRVKVTAKNVNITDDQANLFAYLYTGNP